MFTWTCEYYCYGCALVTLQCHSEISRNSGNSWGSFGFQALSHDFSALYRMECRVKQHSHPVRFSQISKIGYLYATIIPSGSSIASNFCSFRSICSSTNSLPSSEYTFQRDWAIIFIQIAYLMNRLHVWRPSLQMPQSSQQDQYQLNSFLCEFRCSRKKVEKIAVSMFRGLVMSRQVSWLTSDKEI